MSDASWERLRERFTEKYESFRVRLRRRLGSDDLAQEALHETWLRLVRGGEGADSVRHPDFYLFSMCLNIATTLVRKEARHGSRLQIEAAFDVPDETARPAEAVEARLDLEELECVMRDLPPRQRAILLAVRWHHTPIQDVADKLRLSRRSVTRELKLAIDYCAGRLRESVETPVASKPPKATKE